MFEEKGHSPAGIRQVSPFSQITAAHCVRVELMGQTVAIHSNHEHITEFALKVFMQRDDSSEPPDATVVLHLVEADDPDEGVKLLVHHSGHVLHVSLSQHSFFSIDLQCGYATGRITPKLAQDYLEIMLTTVVTNVLQLITPFVPVHAACIEDDAGRGIFLYGPSGIGKSTLTFAAVQSGYGFVSDDAAMLNMTTGKVWGHSTKIGLLPDTVRFFPELAGHALTRNENGEMKIIFDVAQQFPRQSRKPTTPDVFVFLERGQRLDIRVLPAQDAQQRLAVTWSWDVGWQQHFDVRLQTLLQNAYVLTIGDEDPHQIIAFLKQQL